VEKRGENTIGKIFAHSFKLASTEGSSLNYSDLFSVPVRVKNRDGTIPFTIAGRISHD
jgi:hypothetical protein